MTEPKSSVWKQPRWSPLRKLRDWMDAYTFRKALSRPRPRRNYGNAPFETPVIRQEDIDAR